jgi:hypothetical protein
MNKKTNALSAVMDVVDGESTTDNERRRIKLYKKVLRSLPYKELSEEEKEWLKTPTSTLVRRNHVKL